MAHSKSVKRERAPVATTSATEAVSVEQAFTAGYRAGYEGRKREERNQELQKQLAPRRTNDARTRQELLWVMLHVREAEARGETPRNFVRERMQYGSLKTADRRIASARYLLEHDMEFQSALDCYRLVDTR